MTKTKTKGKYYVHFDIEERGKYKLLKFEGVIYGIFRTYKKLKKSMPTLRKLAIRTLKEREKGNTTFQI